MRSDLVVRRQQFQGRDYWVVKEPVGLKYFRFEDEEFAILKMLDGEASFDEIVEQFQARFAPQRLRTADLQQLVGMLHRSGLVIADTPDQGDRLLERRDQRRRRELIGNVSNVLAIRFRGFDPERLLERLDPWTRWFFTPAAVVAFVMLALAALALVVIQFDVFQSRLPSFHEFFAVQNWLLLALVLAGTKVVHEFGHALSCKRFGCECHEMGVMLLVLTPCLYCNVSDSWMLSSRWQRAAIGAAGMYVEVVLAAICTFLWWFSEPGMLHYLCLNVMFVSSVSTIVFNANPLLRYDGYYILSDLLEIPNLRQKASSILHRKLGAWCLGLAPAADPFLPKRHQLLFAFYSVAAAVYRWVVVLSILWFLNKVFEPYGLKILGQVIALAALYGLLVRPLVAMFKFFNVPGRLMNIKRTRLNTTLGIAGTVVAAVVFVPLPSAVYCTLELEARDATAIYIDVPGTLQRVHVRPGQTVATGELLAELANLDLRLAVEKLTGRRDEYRMQLASLEQQRFVDRQAASEISHVRETLETVEDQLRQKERDLARLKLTAPAAGTVLPPPPLPVQHDPAGELPAWDGTPLEAKNLGATLTESTLFCQIGNPRELEAVLVIDQADIERVMPEQEVEILLNQLPGQTYSSEITDVAAVDLKIIPRRLSGGAGGELARQVDGSGVARPLSTSYQALAPLNDIEGILRIGLSGRAKIHTRPTTLSSRAWRYLSRTFHFEL